jgi:hypothetical protein
VELLTALDTWEMSRGAYSLLFFSRKNPERKKGENEKKTSTNTCN